MFMGGLTFFQYFFCNFLEIWNWHKFQVFFTYTLTCWQQVHSTKTENKGKHAFHFDLSASQTANLIGDYWFRISLLCLDGNRPHAPIPRQRQCSLKYDVYWLAWWLLLWGSKYLEYIPESELWNQIKQSTEWESNDKSNVIEQYRTGNRQLLISINKSRVSFKEVEMWPSNTCIALNIFVIMEQTITTLFARY
jgi:hypothetical protein